STKIIAPAMNLRLLFMVAVDRMTLLAVAKMRTNSYCQSEILDCALTQDFGAGWIDGILDANQSRDFGIVIGFEFDGHSPVYPPPIERKKKTLFSGGITPTAADFLFKRERLSIPSFWRDIHG